MKADGMQYDEIYNSGNGRNTFLMRHIFSELGRFLDSFFLLSTIPEQVSEDGRGFENRESSIKKSPWKIDFFAINPVRFFFAFRREHDLYLNTATFHEIRVI